jgi:glycosyltransferase involved in cell wall biosynthesis
MKILLPVDPFVPVPPKYYGGVERIAAILLSKLQHRGHRVALVAHPDSKAPADHFVGWPHVQPNKLVSHVQNTMTLMRVYADFKPDVVHSFSRLLYLVPLLPRKTPKIMSYGRHTGGRQTKVAAFLGGRSLAFTGCSKFIANMGCKHGGRWHAIPNFVETDFYKFSPNVAPNAPLVFLSRIESIKGAHIAIEVAKKTGRRLIIAGNYADVGAEQRYWLEAIKPEVGRNGIEYVGPVDDGEKIRLLGDAAALIVPIQWDEPFGIVFVEALACGTPVISCPRGGLPEIVRDGIDGYLTKGVEEACHAVTNIGNIDRKKCRLRAETEFSADVVVKRYEALYETLLQESF